MATKQKSKIKITRKNVPVHTQLELFGRSAGRCEFSGCNKPVWRNDLTLTERNFGQVAHIIASSEDGPRGSEESSNLQIEFSNLMLLCQQCHKEIDDNPGKYTAELLQEWKWKHEDRIKIQTKYPEDIHRSTVLWCTVNIGNRIVPINQEACRNAMFPKYPTDLKGIGIERKDFDRLGDEAYWRVHTKDIKRKIEREFDKGIDDEEIKHLSVFAIGPMPLLMFLGKCIGDTVPTDLYQSHRNIDDTSQTWSWQEEQETQTSYLVKQICISQKSEKVAILLALSDTIGEDKYATLVDETFSVYEITIEDPSPHFLKNRKQLEHFSYEYRKLLNQIQAAHGHRCQVFILPAVPAPIAVECGRVLLPTKDPEIFACEYYGQDGFKKVLKIN